MNKITVKGIYWRNAERFALIKNWFLSLKQNMIRKINCKRITRTYHYKRKESRISFFGDKYLQPIAWSYLYLQQFTHLHWVEN